MHQTLYVWKESRPEPIHMIIFSHTHSAPSWRQEMCKFWHVSHFNKLLLRIWSECHQKGCGHSSGVIRPKQEVVVTSLYVIWSVWNFKCMVRILLWGDWHANNSSRTLHPLLGTGSKPVIKVIASFSGKCRVVDSAYCYSVLLAQLQPSPTGSEVEGPV